MVRGNNVRQGGEEGEEKEARGGRVEARHGGLTTCVSNAPVSGCPTDHQRSAKMRP